MVIRVLSIARNALVESLRQPIFLFLILICGVLQVLNTWATGFSMQDRSEAEVWGDNKLLLDVGLATIFGCGTLLAAFVATATISREIENKTVLTVVSKPIGRTTVIVGKYLGVTGAIALAVATMLIFLLLAIRHGVMSTASDHLDGPVIVFSLSAAFIAVTLAAWCNFFYGWSFSQTASLVLFPAIVVAYVLVLLLNKEWEWQEPMHDFKGRVMLACALLGLALLVLTAVAVAASTRLGQVMTIMVCAGVFVFGLLADYLVGRRAFHNDVVAYVSSATPDDPLSDNLSDPGSVFHVTLDGPPRRAIRPGASFYYSANTTGFPMAMDAFPPFEGDPNAEGLLNPDQPGRVIVTAVDDLSLTVRRVGGRDIDVVRPPAAGDSVFLEPTRISVPALVVWAVVPNMHYFWLLDAISQNREIPTEHVILIVGYAGALIAANLALAVVLFQRRDVG